VATSADVCYRHPQRESWTLCSRCGRTICPECQILTPAGVRCPTCVQETGGSVTWQRAGGEPKRAPAKPRRSRPQRESSGSGFGAALRRMLRPGEEAPVLSWGVVGLTLVLGLAGLMTGGLPFVLLYATPEYGVEIWRYFTAGLVYPPLWQYLFSILLSAVFFLLTAPTVERNLGRRRFAVMLLASGGIGAAAMVIAGGASFGLSGMLFGMFGSYLIFVWSYPPARVQVLVMIGINLLISLAFGGFFLPLIIGGLIGGAGTTWLFHRADEHSRPSPRAVNLIIAAVVAAFVVFAIIRSLF